MIVPLEKPGTPEELIHFGTKGMKWGVRNERSSSNSSSKTPMSTKKKIAIGAGITAAVIGTGFVAYKLKSNRDLKLSYIKESAELQRGRERMMRQANRHWRRKISAQESSFLKNAAKNADWSIDWNKISKAVDPVKELTSQVGSERAKKFL